MTAARLRSFAIALVVTLPAIGPAVAGTGAACVAQAAGAPHAALVVDNGSRTTTYCVTLDDTSVSGLHLIQLAAEQYGLQYRLGFGGQAVCQLDGIGPTGGDCFADYPDFWGYWHGDGHGGWSWAGSGAASAAIGDGDMEGWVWGPGDSGTTHAAPPALAFDDVCELAPSPAPSPSPPPGGGGGGGSGGGGAGGAGTGTGASEGPGSTVTTETPTAAPTPGAHASAHADRAATTTPAPTNAPEIVEASPVSTLAATASTDGSGPGTGALIALVAVVAVCLAGWFTLRRRRADDQP
jgi:hypothetical protein